MMKDVASEERRRCVDVTRGMIVVARRRCCFGGGSVFYCLGVPALSAAFILIVGECGLGSRKLVRGPARGISDSSSVAWPQSRWWREAVERYRQTKSSILERAVCVLARSRYGRVGRSLSECSWQPNFFLFSFSFFRIRR